MRKITTITHNHPPSKGGQSGCKWQQKASGTARPAPIAAAAEARGRPPYGRRPGRMARGLGPPVCDPHQRLQPTVTAGQPPTAEATGTGGGKGGRRAGGAVAVPEAIKEYGGRGPAYSFWAGSCTGLCSAAYTVSSSGWVPTPSTKGRGPTILMKSSRVMTSCLSRCSATRLTSSAFSSSRSRVRLKALSTMFLASSSNSAATSSEYGFWVCAPAWPGRGKERCPPPGYMLSCDT
mmetsp:Transcript_11329/g.19090  ORF Transcript_11329/g.19090 Transcript_11329/m.19090 type:complete len:235 (-) Transcript_11329:2131-2835(-)